MPYRRGEKTASKNLQNVYIKKLFGPGEGGSGAKNVLNKNSGMCKNVYKRKLLAGPWWKYGYKKKTFPAGAAGSNFYLLKLEILVS